MTSKRGGSRWADMVRAATPADGMTTGRAVAASDTLAPRWAVAPAQASTGVDKLEVLLRTKGRARPRVSSAVVIGICVLAVGIAAHATWRGHAEATATVPTVAIADAPATAATLGAPAAATHHQPVSSSGASARVEATPRLVRASSPSRVLNPIAEAILATRHAPVADDAAAPNDDGVIAELLAELDSPTAGSHAVSPRSAHARARPRHRHRRAAHGRPERHVFPANLFD